MAYIGKPSSGQFDMLKTQLAWVFQLLLQLLDALSRFHCGRAGHSAPHSLQAGFFAGVLRGLGHGRTVKSDVANVLTDCAYDEPRQPRQYR
jgi:hypothetical protein